MNARTSGGRGRGWTIPLALRSLIADIRYAVPAKRWLRANDAIAWRSIYRGWSRPAPPEAWAPLACDGFRVLGDNAESFRLRETLAANAKATLDVATYYIAPDATGWAMTESLVDAARRGVRVRLLVDAHMTKKRRFERSEMDDLIDALRRGGVDLRLYRNPARPFEHSHWKVFVADAQVALTGGRNFADHYRGDAWRDVDVLFEGAAARDLGALFDAAWTGERLARSGPFYAYESSELADATFWQFLHHCIRSAERTVDIEHAYVVAHASVVDELGAAAARGVRVRLLTNSGESNDLVHARFTQEKTLATLGRLGVEVRQRVGAGRTLHCKYLVADGAWVAFGSMNLDYFSPRLCTEITLHTRHEPLASALTTFFEDGLLASAPIASASALSFGQRALGLVTERFFHEFI